LFGVQFDEITNIKKNSKYKAPKNLRSRIAIDRIEQFQKAGLLKVIPITINAKKDAYADPVIVEVLTKQSQEGKFCTLFSDDKELRIRVRQKFYDRANADWNIIEMEKILPDCKKIALGMELILSIRRANQNQRK